MAGTARQQRADRGSAQPLAPPVPDHSHQRPFFARPARLSSLVVAAGLHKLWAQSRLALPAQAHSCAPFTHSVSKSGCQPGSFQASIGGSLLASSEDLCVFRKHLSNQVFLCFRVEVFDGEWSHALFTSRIADIVIARNYHDTITIAVYKRLSKLGE